MILMNNVNIKLFFNKKTYIFAKSKLKFKYYGLRKSI